MPGQLRADAHVMGLLDVARLESKPKRAAAATQSNRALTEDRLPYLEQGANPHVLWCGPSSERSYNFQCAKSPRRSITGVQALLVMAVAGEP